MMKVPQHPNIALAIEALEKSNMDAAWHLLRVIPKETEVVVHQLVPDPVAINEVQKLSDGFIENPEAIMYLLDCLRWVQGDEGLPQTHYNFIRAFQRKGNAVLQRLKMEKNT